MKENKEKSDVKTSVYKNTNDWRYGQYGGEEVEISYSRKTIEFTDYTSKKLTNILGHTLMVIHLNKEGNLISSYISK